MSDEKKLEALLSQSAARVFEQSTDEAHVSDERLASDPLPAWTKEETTHFARCEECRALLADRAVSKNPANVRSLYPRRLISFAAAAAAIFFGFLIFGRDPGMRSKGSAVASGGAELTLIATSSTGVRRDLRSGGTLQLSDSLGFKYGNPEGKYRSISVLGYDGRTIHWYYPENAENPAQAIEKTEAIGTRLPFDIGLKDDHRPGKLQVIVAFDADPRVLAAQVERGTPPIDAQIFELEILGGPK